VKGLTYGNIITHPLAGCLSWHAASVAIFTLLAKLELSESEHLN